MLLTTGTELLMGESEVGVETPTALPSLRGQSPQSAGSTQLVAEGLELPALECQCAAPKQRGPDSCELQCWDTKQGPQGEVWPCLPLDSPPRPFLTSTEPSLAPRSDGLFTFSLGHPAPEAVHLGKTSTAPSAILCLAPLHLPSPCRALPSPSPLAETPSSSPPSGAPLLLPVETSLLENPAGFDVEHNSRVSLETRETGGSEVLIISVSGWLSPTEK